MGYKRHEKCVLNDIVPSHTAKGTHFCAWLGTLAPTASKCGLFRLPLGQNGSQIEPPQKMYNFSGKTSTNCKRDEEKG
ncbi:hypothetical protein CEXT_773781 [Caerostris extrusa]|uniref:Uncharacterized protein n=1 Tax=Caerostris extrusa TaxID=172846 RepID=A0AAV4XYL4_CAEEX|nr:hypothetical protein CEXT_773781 [Caerostris extrusa]